MKIVPAMLVHDVVEYNQQIRVARQLTDRFHVDIIDGQFVENTTIKPRDIQKQIDNKLDMHLMVVDPVSFARECIRLNPYTVIIQVEVDANVSAALELVKKNGFRAGISINPSTQVKDIKQYIDVIDYIQVMGYDAGFEGQKLQRSVLPKISELHALLKPTVEIGFDGGVGASTIASLKKTDLDIINVNSYLFRNEELDTLSAYSKLLESTL